MLTVRTAARRGALVLAALGAMAGIAAGAEALGPVRPSALAQPSTPAVPAQPPAETPATPAEKPLALDLATTLRLGLLHNRDIRLAHYALFAAQAAENHAWSVYLPQVTLTGYVEDSNTYVATGGSGNNNNNNNNNQNTNTTTGVTNGVAIQVSQLLFDLGQGLFQIYKTHQLTKAATFDELAAQLTAASTISADFFAALSDTEIEALDGKLVDEAKLQQDQAQARLEARVGAQLDLLRAQVATSNAEVTWKTAASTTGVALATLRRDLGLPPGAPIAVTPATAVPPVDLGLRMALGLGAKRPSVASLEAQKRAAKHGLDSARVQRWVSLTVTGSYQQYLASSYGYDHDYDLLATVTVPLFDGGAGAANEKTAYAAWLTAGESVLKERDQEQVDIESAWLAYRDAQDILAGAEASSKLALEVMNAEEDSYRQGVASFLDASDARTAYASAETSRITASINRDSANMSLRVAVGRLPLLDQAAAVVRKEQGR